MDEDKDYQLFVDRIKRTTGIDLSLYKEAQMRRRLTTLRLKRGYADFAEYFRAAIQSEPLFLELLDRITINVSEFFRNPCRWEFLGRKVLPEILSQNRRIKCWSAACSTGEEPYTLAMILANSGAVPPAQISIIATDLDQGALDRAKQGVYNDRAVREVPPLFLSAYFDQRDAGFPNTDNELCRFAVKDEIKRMVVFKKHNLLADPFESGFDLIVCRNVFIYFTDAAKTYLCRQFSQSLNPGGYLYVGATEQIFSPDQYSLESVAPFFYRKKE